MAIDTKPERQLEDQVEQILRDANLNYKREVVIGDARPDFVVTTDAGDQIVVEVKAWEGGPEMTARALHQAQRYQELSGTAGALVVCPAVRDRVASTAFAAASPDGVVDALTTLAASLAKRKKVTKRQPVRRVPKKKVFASMPFALQYDDTFLVAIGPASLSNSATAERVDHYGTAGPVVPQIKAMIKAARVIVADLSESRPNVLHEVGYAEALRKPVIQICSTPTADLPFNVRNNKTIKYALGQTAKLKKTLEIEIAKYL